MAFSLRRVEQRNLGSGRISLPEGQRFYQRREEIGFAAAAPNAAIKKLRIRATIANDTSFSQGLLLGTGYLSLS